MIKIKKNNYMPIRNSYFLIAVCAKIGCDTISPLILFDYNAIS